ncbi:unnamed protein product [Camellia sinensis]
MIYGTGTIMAVPAHDMHDHEFALKYDIPICWVVMPDGGSSGDSERPYSGEAISVNSSSPILGLDINGLPSKEAASKVIEWVEKIGNGNKKVNYKLRDWLFALQRYWGEPIPVVFLKDTGEGAPLPESELPLALPELDDFTPTGTGEPPLSKAVSWVVTTDPLSGKPARRETNTMPQWAGSCWYYMRFMDLKNSEALVDKMKEMYWSPVDVYVGDAEHAVLHLLYSRFWHKVLYDIGVLIQTSGLSEGKYSCLVTKDSDGNFISADSVDVFGEHHQERIPDEKASSRKNTRCVHRFLGTVWRLIVGSSLPNGKFRDGTVAIDKEPLLEQLRFLHKCIDKVTEEIEGTRFNTGISAMMEFINAAYKADPVYRKESTVVLPVQINGKTRGTIQVEETCTENDAFKLASIDQKLSKYLDCRNVRKKSYR